MKRLFLFTLAVFFSAVALSDVSRDGKWQYIKGDGDPYYYYLKEGEVALRGGTTEDGILPSEVDGYSVAAIADYAQITCLTDTLVVPSSVRTICAVAFQNNSFRTVVLQEGVEVIGESAFCWCRNLESVVLPKSLKCIGTQAFCGCEHLANVELPSGLEYLGWHVFRVTPLEKNVTDDLWIIGDCLVECRNKSIESTVVPHDVRLIASGAFNSCTNMFSISIPSSVRRICSGSLGAFLLNDDAYFANVSEEKTFWNCPKLKQVHVNDLESYGGISFAFWHANPMNYANELYVAGELAEGTCTVTFYDENWGIYDPESEYSYVRSKTIEVGMGKGVLNPPEVMSMDMDKVFDGWDGDLLCVTSDMSVRALFRQKTISEICDEWSQRGMSPVVEEQYYFYDKNAHCLRFQGELEMDEYLLEKLSWSKAWTTGYNQNTPYIEIVGYSESWEEISRTWGWLMMIGEKNTIMFKMSDAETNGVSYVEIVLKSSNYDGEYPLLTLGINEVEVRSPTSYHLDWYGTESLRGVKSGDVVCYQMENRYDGHSSRSVSAYLDGKGASFYLYDGDSSLFSWGESGYSWFEWIVPFAEKGGEREYREFCVADQCYDRYYYDGKDRWNTTTYLAVINPDIMTYNVMFDLNGCSRRIGGGGLEQVVEDGMTAEAPQIEPLEGWCDVRWTPDPNCPITNDTQFAAHGSAVNYAIQFVDTKGANNPNPLTYTVTNEIVFAELADTDEYWFKSWEPAKIEVGTTGDLVVTAKWDRIQGVAEAAGDQNRGWVSSGDADWFVTWNDTKGKYVVRSGEIGNNQTSVLETVVVNAGTISFSVATSCEETYRGRIRTDGLSFLVDGNEVMWLDGEGCWSNVLFSVSGDGEHRLQWRYGKDAEGARGDDCAYLTDFMFYHEVVVRFSDGGATEGDVPEPIHSYNGAEITLPELGALRNPKHAFCGWSDGGKIYQPGERFLLGDVAPVFTSQWEEKRLVVPVISVAASYATETTSVTISADKGAAIRYTLDGTDPTETSAVYIDSFEVAGSTTIKAAAFRDDWFASPVVVATTVRLPWTYGR